MAGHVESQTYDLAEALNIWQERIEHLQAMTGRIGEAAWACHSQTIQRMRTAWDDARGLISESESMTPEQWIDARTEILAVLQALQRDYNAILADWPQE